MIYMREAQSIVQFSSGQSLHRLGRPRDMRDDSAEILFQSFLHEAFVNSSGMDRNAHVVHAAFPLAITAPPILRDALKDVCVVLLLFCLFVFERLLGCMTCPNRANFRLLTVARNVPRGTTRELILLRSQYVLNKNNNNIRHPFIYGCVIH